MKIITLGLFGCLLLLGCAVKTYKYSKVVSLQDFKYVRYQGDFKIRITEFHKNNALCGSVLTYAIIIGNIINVKLPPKLSVLSLCDLGSYKLGDTLTVTANNDTTLYSAKFGALLNVETKTIHGLKHLKLIGAEYPAIWGSVISGAH